MRRIPAKGIKKYMTEGDVTRLLGAAGAGDRAALERLYSQVYDELRRLAEARLRHERPVIRCNPPRWSTRPTCA